MDLTPPSLTYSPSPSHQDISSSPSSFTLHSPRIEEIDSTSAAKHQAYYTPANLLALSYRPISPHSSVYSSPVPDHFDGPDNFSHLESMSQATWSTASPLISSAPAISATSSITNIISAEHNPFANYEPGLSHSYGPGENYPPPNVSSSAMAQMASPALSAAANSPTPDTIRASLNYSPSDVKFHSPHLPYTAGLGGTSYPVQGLLHGSYSTEVPQSLPPTSQPNLADAGHMGWKSELDSTAGFYSLHPFEASSVPPYERRAVARPPANTRAAEHKKRRQHTKKEEANFQCQVKGCGKFFSRSYNFKSHMETHDEKREYPFPCQESDCNKKFVRKTDLQRHHQSVHAKERNHKCDYCGRMFARKDTLRRFVAQTKLKKRNFQANIMQTHGRWMLQAI